MNESQSLQCKQESRAWGQLTEAVGQPFILSFISKYPHPPHSLKSRRSGAPGAAGPRGRETGRGGAGRLLRNLETEPGQRACWVPGSRDPSFFSLPCPHITHSDLSLHKVEPWRYRVLRSRTGHAKPTLGASDPGAGDLCFPHGSFGVVSVPGLPPFPPSRPPAEASRGHEAAARPTPVPSVPTGSVLLVRGQGPSWAV